MRVSVIATALASASLASARIVGIAAPSTIAANSTFTLTLLTENYIQSVADIAVAWGFSESTSANPTGHAFTLGADATSAFLGPGQSNTLKNITVLATLPKSLSTDKWHGKDIVLSAGIFSLYGASGGSTVTGYNVTVTIDDETAEELVRSKGSGWRENGEC